MHERMSELPPPLEQARGGDAVMDIQRMITQGASWPVALDHLPALLDVVDDQAMPLDICLDQGTGSVSLHTEPVRCRLCGRTLLVDGPGTALSIDLDLLAEARAVSCIVGTSRRISLELIGCGRNALLTITGPQPGSGLAGDVWQLVMEALMPEAGYFRGRRDGPVVTVQGLGCVF